MPAAPTTTPSPPVERRLLFADEIKHKFGYRKASSVLRLVRDEGLPAHRPGRRYLFDPAEVDAWLRDHSTYGITNDHRALIKRLVDAAPELTDEQVAKIRGVLGGAR